MSTAQTKETRLAINGGSPSVAPGTIKKWPPIDDSDRAMVMASLEGANHAFGPNCEALQAEFAQWNDNRFAVTTNSGTAALHMCITACECGTGDEIIVPAYSWSSSATCILQHNCIPVFVDVDFDTMNIDTAKIEAAITPKTKAIIVVHLHGLPVEMESVLALAKKHGIKVIEDACQAHGALYKGKKVGNWGDCAAFSLNQNKSLCSGEGGFFVTNDEDMLAKAKMLWSFGETRTPSESRDYHVYAMGWMYRNNDLTAAFGRSQLKKLDQTLQIQKENAMCFHESIKGAPGIIRPTVPENCEPNWYAYVLRFDMQSLGHEQNQREFRDRIVEALQAEGIRTDVWQKFILPAMTVFQAKNGYGQGCPWDCPHSDPVDYSLEQYPAAQAHCDSHTCLVQVLRAPNGRGETKLLADGVRKVMENADQL